MKVEELIRDTERFVATSDDQPRVSVLLSLASCSATQAERAVKSVLGQTLEAVELIVVDDTCDGDVAEWLEQARQRDSRMSVLRHREVIGIPAVGWIEAAQLARGAYFVLAREEDEFRLAALDDLLEHAGNKSGSIGFGYVETMKADQSGAGGASEILEDRSQSMIMLRVTNFIARNAVLIPRDAVKITGFVDPHLLLAQVAEWDFWRRFSEYFEMVSIDVAVGVRHVADDKTISLPYDRWAVEEWMRTDRNELLILERVDTYDVFDANPSHGRPTRDVCAALASSRGVSIVNNQQPVPEDEGYVLVVVVQYDASVALYFDMLPEPFARRVLIVPNHPQYYRKAMARASAVVVVRAVRTYQACVALARELGIRTYYFLDDNLSLLEQTGEARIPGEDFSFDSLRNDLKPFDGVFLSSPQMLEYFEQHSLHTWLRLFPVVCASQEREREVASFGADKDPDEIVLAFMGGFARSKALWDVIMPALVRIGETGVKIHFIAPGARNDAELLSRLPPNLRVTLLPWDHGYAYVVRRFARFAPDYMLLSASGTPNNQYKTLHPLLTARLIDAVAVLPFIDPYRDISDGSVGLIVDKPFDRDAWYAMLRRIVDRTVDVRGIKKRNRAYCADVFAGNTNVRVLKEVVREAFGTPPWPIQFQRIDALGASSYMRGTSSAESNAGEQALQRNAEELLALRRGRRYSWRHRILARPSDLWAHCSPTFWPLQRDSLQNGWKRRGGTLELSDSLHDKPYYDYEVALPAGTFAGISIAIATDGPQQGKFIVELISPSKTVVARAVRELARVDLMQPVKFAFNPIRIERSESWRVRLRARSPLPIYVYELVNRRGLRMFYAPSSPFMQLISSNARVEGVSPSIRPSKQGAGLSEDSALMDVKMVIEGDIPTNQIIGRLIEEALGTRGTLDKVLVKDLTPDMVADGGTVILSRISSPSAVPMINWMNSNSIPFLYYIDDNFWELKGDTPLAQYYQCEPVRSTMRHAIESAKAIVVNSPLLGEYIKKRHPKVRVICLSAPFDFSLIKYTRITNKAPGEIRIGFAGSITRAGDFVEILPALERLLVRYHHVSLTFFGFCPPELMGRERVTFVAPVADYAQFIALKASHELDIGLAPLTADDANIYKTNNKYREYGALKIAGIYSNVTPYKESVIGDKTGLLVDHQADAWYAALERLVLDADLRAAIAHAAFDDVKEHYAQGVVAEQWSTMLSDFARANLTGDRVEKANATTTAAIQARQYIERIRIRLLMVMGRMKAAFARSKPARKQEGKG